MSRLEEIDLIVDDLLNNRIELTSFVDEQFRQAERVDELEKERNEYKSALSEIKRFPTYMTKDNYVSRSLKISKRVLRKWDK